MRRITLSPVVSPVASSLKRRDFREEKKTNEHKIYVFWFRQQLLSEIFIILWRILWDIIINEFKSRVKYPLVLRDFNQPRIFWKDTREKKNAQIWNFMKIRPVGAELFHADGRTDMTRLTVAFLNFANASKSELLGCGIYGRPSVRL